MNIDARNVTPLVTIITPTYNQGQFIEATICSVLGQTYRNIEYIVIDGMSTDKTEEILDKYKDDIGCIVREPDNGQGDAIIKGFKLAKGELVGWINSDDILYPDCIERLINAYQGNPDAVLFHDSVIDIIDISGEILKTLTVPLGSRENLLRKENTLVQPGSFYAADALLRVSYFDSSLRYSMDLDLWLRLLAIGKSFDIGGPPIAGYREWGGTKTSTGGNRLTTERISLLLKHGAKVTDQSVRHLKLSLIKFSIKAFCYDRLKCNNLIRYVCLFLYYGFARHLPASNSKFTKWIRPLRRVLCAPLFRASGVNINIEKGARFGTGQKITIGDNSGLGINCNVLGVVRIGNNVMIGPDVLFITSAHNFDSVDVPMIEQGISHDRPINIDDDVWIGARSILLPGVTVGTGSIIGAGSVVTKSIPNNTIAAGNPARVIRQRTSATVQ